MCGIVGYIGTKDAREIILSGLEKLEYRGYDSAGIALFDQDKIKVYKDKGRVENLKSLVDYSFETHLGIGHTRWATHGKPNKINSHPHISNSGRFMIVHNGVIENYRLLKLEVLKDFSFYSETDTEVIVNLVEFYARTLPTEKAIRKAVSNLEGSFALLILDQEAPDKLFFVKNKTPMLVGVANDGIVLASDTMALVGYAHEFTYLEDKTIGVATKDGFKLFDVLGTVRKPNMLKLNISADNIGKGDYDHYMLKEIHEQPGVIRNLILKYFDGEQIVISPDIIAEIKAADKLYIVACGTSLHAGYVAKFYFERLCHIPVETCIASEALYLMPLLSKHPFFIFVSQSGETADVISVIKKCKELDIKTLALTNSPMSSVEMLCNHSIHLEAGKEISVASTKAYTAQVVTFAILAKVVSGERTNLKTNLNRAALVIEELLNKKEIFKEIAKSFINAKDVFFIGRGLDYYVAMEAALKLKEISYIHAEGFASGELKHGAIALIEPNTPVIALITEESTNMITRSNVIETEAKGSMPIIISMDNVSRCEDNVVIPDVASYLTPIVSVVVCQLIAYYSSVLRGNDVDKPRNLAKSVTVE